MKNLWKAGAAIQKTWLDSLARFMAEPRKLDGKSYASFRYGLEVLYIFLRNTTLDLLLAALLGVLPEAILFMAVYALIRSYSFGIHLDTATGCFCLSATFFLGGSLLAANIAIPWYGVLISFAVLAPLYLRYAPGGSKQRPIGQKEKPKLKLLSFLLLTLVHVCALILPLKIHWGPLRGLLVFACAAQCINILPITYRILRKGVPKAYEKAKEELETSTTSH